MLAIIIPYFKGTFFQSTLQSLDNQTNNNFNIYIGNDASPEDPEETINKYKTELNITYYRFADNLGGISLTRQWDRCIALAKDEPWIMILGDDDFLGPSCVQDFYENIERINKLNIKVIRYSTIVIDEQGKSTSKQFFHPTIQEYNDMFYSRFFKKSRSSLSEYIFSREKYQKYGFRDLPLAWHSDDLAWLEFSEFGKIYTINEGIVYFRISSLNISRPDYFLEQKKEISYKFYSIIVNEYLNKFNKEVRIAILKRFELMSYDLKKASFNFWLAYFLLFSKNYNFVETLKFSRRVYLNRN